MELLFLIELTAKPDRREFPDTRSFPVGLDVDYVIAGLVAGFPKALPAKAILLEAWGTADQLSDTHDVRQQLLEIAKEPLIPAATMPRSGPPPKMASIALDPDNPEKRWRVALYGGSTRDCEVRKKYCLWVLSPPDRQSTSKLTTAVSRFDNSLENVQAPSGFRQSLERMDDLLDAMEKYSHERLQWLSRGSELLHLDADSTREIQSHLTELREKTASLGRPPMIAGDERIQRLKAEWPQFFAQFDQLKEMIPPKALKSFLQEYLALQVGHRIDSLEERKAFAGAANRAALSLGLRFACAGTADGTDGVRCNQPATLRCDKFSERDSGSFFFSHSERSKAFRHGFSGIIPDLVLVPAAPRAARTTRKASKGSSRSRQR